MNWSRVRALRLTRCVHDFEQMRMLETRPAAAPVAVYLKLNTGMNRLGFAAGQVAQALERLRG